MMVKFEGKNRSYKISNLLGKEETLNKNEKYLIIPIIVTNTFLRIYTSSNEINRKEEDPYLEINKKELSNELTYDVFFENQIKQYIEKVNSFLIIFKEIHF